MDLDMDNRDVIVSFTAIALVAFLVGYGAGEQSGSEGYQNYIETSGYVPDGDTQVVFTKSSFFNRTFSINFDDAGYTYECQLSRDKEYRIGEFSHKYEDVDCSVENFDAVEKYDDPEVTNEKTITDSNQTE